MKNIQELEEALKAEIGLEAKEHAVGTTNGAGIDTKDYDTALITVNAGTATGTLDVKLQESSDDGASDAYADITDAAFTQIDNTNHQAVYVARIKVKSYERYIRVVGVVATDVVEAGVTVHLAKYDGLAPVSQNNAVAFALDYESNGGTVGSEAT